MRHFLIFVNREQGHSDLVKLHEEEGYENLGNLRPMENVPLYDGYSISLLFSGGERCRVTFTDYVPSDTKELDFDDVERILAVKVSNKERLRLVDISELYVLGHHRRDYGLNLSIAGKKVTVKANESKWIESPEGWPAICIGKNLHSEALKIIIGGKVEEGFKGLFDLHPVNEIAEVGGAGQKSAAPGDPLSGERQGSAIENVVWIFGKDEEDRSLSTSFAGYWDWYPPLEEPGQHVLFIPAAERRHAQYLSKIEREVEKATAVFIHGPRDDERRRFGTVDVLDYGSADVRYDEMLREVKAAKTAKDLAEVAGIWVGRYRERVERDAVRFFKHRLVNMFDPLVIDAASLEAELKTGDVNEVDRLLSEIREDWERFPGRRPLSVLDAARHFVFGKPGSDLDQADTPRDAEVLEHYETTGRVSTKDTVISCDWCDQKRQICDDIAELLGVKLTPPEGAVSGWGEEESWLPLYLRTFQRFLLGDGDQDSPALGGVVVGASLLSSYLEAGESCEQDFIARGISLSGGLSMYESLGRWLVRLNAAFEKLAPERG